MTVFRDSWPGIEWCSSCYEREATTSVQHPDLGIDLSGRIESMRVCDPCATAIYAELDVELDQREAVYD